MARFAVIFSVICSLFLLSHARYIPVDLLNGDSLPVQSQLDLPNGDSLPLDTQEKDRATIRLPSEKLEALAWPPSDDVDATSTVKDIRSFTEVSFIPINRHFPHHHAHGMTKKRPFWFRFPHRCRGHARHRIPRQISYGRDMIGMPERHQVRAEAMLFPVEGRHMPARWMGHVGHMRHIPERHMDFWKEGEHKEEEGGFIKRFRDFLNRFLRA